MVIKKIRSPLLSVAAASSWNIPTTGMWSINDARTEIYSPKLNGNILAIITSFGSTSGGTCNYANEDTEATFSVCTRDLKSTTICSIADTSTNKAASIRFPQFWPTSAASATLVNTIAANSGGITMPLPVCDSLAIKCIGATSTSTVARFELYYDQ